MSLLSLLIRLLREFLRPYSARLVLVLALLLVQAVANLYLPDLNARLIDDGVAKGDVGVIMREGGVMLGVSLLLGLAAVVAVYFAAQVATAFGHDVRAGVFTRVESFSAREVNHFGTPSLITRNTNDVQQVQMLVLMSLVVMISAPITMVGGIIMALRQDVALSTLLVIILPLMALVIGSQVARLLPLFRAMQVKIDRINQVLREQITGVRVVRAFVRDEHEGVRFAGANADLTSTALRVTRIFALMMPALFGILNLSTVAITWFGGQRVDHGGMQIGQLTAFLTYIMQILIAVMMATFMVIMVPRAAASAERIRAVLDTESSVVDPADPVTPAAGVRGVVELAGVEFRYPGAEKPVLRDVSLTLAPGQTTAVVGSTGSGKTTLVSLIPRLFDVSGGAVRVDGVDVRRLSLETLWSKIGLAPQRAFLFTGTIASNLRFGREQATDAELWHALEVAQARDFVEALEGGLLAEVAQGGTNLSGGQRQRLAIARALVKRPEVYIFDDTFSALDYATDARLRAALRAETSDAAVLIVAQRVSTILRADQIVVLDDGVVVDIGTHEQLLGRCETYQEIVSSQLTPEEAA